MITGKKIFGLVLTTVFIFAFISCQKPAGPGGRGTIKGKVHVKDYDNTQAYFDYGKGYQAGVRVYICYGDENLIGDDTRTGVDGTFEFRHLNKGKYRVFVNTLDTTHFNKGNDRELPLIKNAEIKSPTEVVTLEQFNINI